MSHPLRQAALEYLWRQLPNHCLLLTDPLTLVFIDLGLARAARHGFTQREDVCLYLALMVFLGSYFDEDPQYPWAAELLSRRAPMPTVYTRAIAEQEPVIGQKGERYTKALLRARSQSVFWALDEHTPPRAAMAQWLATLFPGKAQSMQGAAWDALLDTIEQLAQRHGLGQGAGLMGMATLVFLLGHGIDKDPLHPWVGHSLAAPSPSLDEKVATLHARALLELARFMKLDRYMRAR